MLSQFRNYLLVFNYSLSQLVHLLVLLIYYLLLEVNLQGFLLKEILHLAVELFDQTIVNFVREYVYDWADLHACLCELLD